MSVKTRVAVICQSVADPRVYHLAMAATAAAWDAGAEVRVRRVGEVAAPDGARANPECEEILRDCEYIPEATPADLEWADVALFGTPTRDGAVVGHLKRFIDATVPLWKEGKVASKVYGVFTGAARREGTGTRLLSLADVFAYWGGIVVAPAGPAVLVRRDAAPCAPAAARTVPIPTEAELAAAREQGRQAAEAAHALKAARCALADVA